MTQYSQPLERRPQAGMRELVAGLRALQSKTAVLETGCLVTPYVGTIPATYTSGHPTVTLATGVTIGPLQYVDTYTPHAGDTVLCVPVGQAYIVVGAVV
jgi:hypothetical protein